MARRMIDGGMWSNENFAALPAMARLLLIGIITLADDQGRCKANPAYLRSQIFPYEDIATGDIDWWMERMADNGTLILYNAGGKSYLQLINWWSYQPLDWARPSEYPAPDGWQDRIRFNAKGGVYLTHNWRTKSGAYTPDTCDSRGNPLTQVSTPVSTPVDTWVSTGVDTGVGVPTNKLNLNKTTTTTTGSGGSSFESLDPADPVLALWAENMGDPAPAIRRQLSALVETHGASPVLEAIEIAIKADRRNMRYVEGVLRRRDPPTPSANGTAPRLERIGDEQW